MFPRKLFHCILIAVVLPCLLFTTACNESQVRESALAAHRIVASVSAATDIKDELLTAELIDSNESKQIAILLRDANRAALAFNDKVKEYSSQKTIPPNARDELLTLFDDVTATVAKLNDQGVLHIKNETARSRLAAVLATINASISVIKGVLKNAG